MDEDKHRVPDVVGNPSQPNERSPVALASTSTTFGDKMPKVEAKGASATSGGVRYVSKEEKHQKELQTALWAIANDATHAKNNIDNAKQQTTSAASTVVPSSIGQVTPPAPVNYEGIEVNENDAETLDSFGRPSLDVDSNETDSALGDMTPRSSTMSINSELYNHVEENGRTYHRYKQGKYALPNDEMERNRLDIQHQLMVLILHGELHLSPLKSDVNNVLDIATGTGIWAVDFALKYPSSNVLGTDLSPIQPAFVPANCRFEIDDAEDEWNYRQKFDYIHGRLLLSCFNTDFPAVIRKAYDALNPGGWFELQDMLPPMCFDDTWEGSEFKRWVELTCEGAKALGMDWFKVGKYKKWVEEAGFEEVTEFKAAAPMNTWPRGKHHKLLGAWMNQDMMEGLHGISVACLTRGLGMTSQEVEVLLVGTRRDLCDRNIHCFAPVRVIYGRKPFKKDS